MKKKYLIFIAAGIISTPLWMWGAWVLTPKKKMVLAIVDKTETSEKGKQHTALTWILNNEKYSKTHNKLYDINSDYYGYFPDLKSKLRVRGLERFTNAQLDQLSSDCDVAYYVDTYGVYTADFPDDDKNRQGGGGLLYGGLSQQDINFLSRVKRKNKLIIAENNLLDYPTHLSVKKQFEALFAIQSTGWSCRYFESLRPEENKDLPYWVVNNFKARNKGKWPFTAAGVVFVHTSGEVVVLQDFIDLNNPLPFISSTGKVAGVNISDDVKYPFWLDIITTDTTVNKVVADVNISYNEKGKEQLLKHNIPLDVPAVVAHIGNDYQFYYFSGNFCSINSLSISSSYYKGISGFKNYLYNEDETMETTSFFWNFYRPLMTSILREYYIGISKKELFRQ